MLVFLLCCSAFFSSAETALFSLNSVHVHRIRRKRKASGEAIESLLSAPSQLLSTILIGNTLVNVAAAGLGFVVAEGLFPDYGEAVAIPAMTILLLILGEVAPKRLAMRHPERLAVMYSPTLKRLISVFMPFRLMLAWVSGLFMKEPRMPQKSLSEDEFRTVVEVGEEEGVLDEEEREMVDGIIRLEETQASDIMTPRVDLVGIDMDDSPEKRKKAINDVRYRYLPVYTDSLDNVHGFLDVPRYRLSGEEDFAKSMVAPYSIPETAPLDTLLSAFQKENKRVAIVVDEYGGTAGLVTRGDILEEIVDDVDAEYGEEKLSIQEMGQNKWLINGNTSLEDINYELDTTLDAEGADRIAGWVNVQAERIPRKGEVVTAQGCRVIVEQRRKNRITLVLLEKI
jgi:putative hemolysin